MPKYYNKVPFIKKTDADWTSLNPILMDGEVILVTGEDEIVRLKVGDGVSNYSELDYISDGSNTYGTRMKIGDGVSTYSNLRFVTFSKNGFSQEQYEELLSLIEDTNARIDGIEGEDGSIETINKNIESINTLIGIIRSDLNDTLTTLGKQEVIVNDALELVDQTFKEVENISTAIDNLDTETKKINETIDIFRENINSHDDSISNIFSKVTNLESLGETVSTISKNVNNLTSDVNKNTNDIVELKGRVDSLTDSSNGNISNETIAELIDIRTDHNGKIYSTAGEAVRALGKEISAIKDSDINPDDLGLTSINGIVYPTYKNVASIHGIKIEGSGGGGTINPEYLFRLINKTEAGENFSVSYGDNVIVSYEFIALDPFTNLPTGNGTAYYSVNSNQISIQTIKQGINSFDCTKYLIEGNNTISVTVKNADGETKSIEWTVRCLSVRLESRFSYDYIYTDDSFTFRYTSYGEDIEKHIHFILDGVEDSEVFITSASGETYSKTFDNLTHGVHTLEVYAIGYVNGSEIRSNTLKYDVIIALSGNTTPIIGINCEQTSLKQGELIKIPYIAYDPQNTKSNVTLEIHQLVNEVYELYHSETHEVDSSLQNWNTRNYPIGSIRFTVRLGDISRSINVTVEKADLQISAVTTDLELYLSSANRSNTEKNPATWEYKGKKETITTDFNNVNWASSGWVLDDNGDTCLRLQGGSTATINFKPFATEVRMLGKTIEFEFAIKNINNRNASVISCVENGIGINITADSAILTSSKLRNSCHISDERKLRVSFTIESTKEYRMMSIYLDGVLTNCMQYDEDDNFQQNALISIGSPYCTIDLYTVRVYNTALTQKNVVNNYISDIIDLTEKTELYHRNNIYDSSMKLDYAKVKNQIPVMTITGTLPPSKGEKQQVTITYEDPFDSTMNFYDWESTIDVQGTSSQYYVRKNYKIKFPEKYAHTKGGIATKTYCMKADYAEATSTHNTQIANFVHNIYDSKSKTPAQLIHPNCRTTIQGFPCVIYHKSSIDSKPTFLGKYNFNYDKGSEEVFFGEPEDGLKVESWEFCNNDSDACNFLDYIPDEYNQVEIVDGVEYQRGWCKTFERRYPDNDLIADGDEDPEEAIKNFRKMHDWVVKSKKYNVEDPLVLIDYKKEFEEIFDLEKMLIYYVWTFFFLMVDQRAKNMFMTYWEKTGKWEPWFYDNDTCLGINNEGKLVYDYYHEDTDYITTISPTGEEIKTKVYNGQDSVLWNKFRVAYADKIQEKYRTLRSSGKLTYNKIRDQFVIEGSDKWSETIYNEDSDFKYISMLRDPAQNSAVNLPQIKGTGEHHLDYFLDARINYCDSKWNAAGWTEDANDQGYAQDYIFLRINTPQSYGDVIPNASITVTPFSDMYAGVKYNSNGTLVQKRLKQGEKYTFTAPTGSNFNDTDTSIFGASQLSSIGDLSPLYCHYCDISKAKKLIELKLGSEHSSYTSKLDSLDLGANTLLKKIDVRNCNSLINPLNLIQCSSIEEILAEGSSISGMNLPSSGYLKTVHLPSTVVTLTLKNQNYIEDFKMESYVNIRTLTIENTKNIPIDDIILAEPMECRYLDFSEATTKVDFGMRYPALERVRLMNVTWDSTEEKLRAVCNKLKQCKGLDENGMNIDKAVVNGIVNVPSINDEFLKELNTSFPELMVCENGKNLCAVSYYNHGSTEPIYVAIVEQGTNAPDIVAEGIISIPERPSTNTEKYVYRGWSDSLENIQKNKSVSVVYDTYYAVRFMNGDSQFHIEFVKEGSSATDPLASGIQPPTKESSVQYDFTFTGWDKPFDNITSATYIYAVYSETIRSYMVTFYNENDVILEQKLIKYGEQATYTGNTPIKPNVAYPQDYKFKGWTPELGIVEGETSYHAEFYESDHILDNWYDIANNVENGTYKEKYPIGILHRFTLNYEDGKTEEVDVELIGYDHDITEDGKTCGLTFMLKNVLKNTYYMSNDSKYNNVSWKDSNMRKYLNDKILPALPKQLTDVIVPVVKTTFAGTTTKTINTVDSIWLPSIHEMSYEHKDYYPEGRTYEMFITKDSETVFDVNKRRVKLNYNNTPIIYWLRSPVTTDMVKYWSVGYDGSPYILSRSPDFNGVAFAFCIGKK